MQQNSSHWVFGYGSLIWRPGFQFIRSVPALLPGAHRRLCVFSFRHRGTAARPGLVFGLVRGGSCRGMAFEVEPERWDEVRRYLREREMDNGVYRGSSRPVQFTGGGRAEALTFLVDEHHPQFAGRLELAEQVRLVRGGVGESGPNPEYVLETAHGLKAIGIRGRYIDALIAALDGVDMPMVATA